jgi:hypothetical protein
VSRIFISPSFSSLINQAPINLILRAVNNAVAI